MSTTTADELTALINAKRQTNRLLRLSFPDDDGPKGVMVVVNRLEAFEGLSRDFQFTIEALSDSPDIQLKDVMGKRITVTLTRDDGTLRYFNGHVFDFRFVKNDAGFSYYDIVLLPWLAFARYRKDNYLFHGNSLTEQTTEILDDYPMNDWVSRHLDADPAFTDACQFDESDYNYLHRRWESQGWHYWYEHREDGHTLVLSGDSTRAEPIDGGEMHWSGNTRGSGVVEAGVWTFSPIRSVASTGYVAASYDFKKSRPMRATTPTLNRQGDVVPGAPLEIYEYTGGYGLKNEADGNAFVRCRIEEIEAQAKHVEASGDDDHGQCGRSFKLVGHQGFGQLGSEDGDNEFLLIDVRHSASNNYETRDGGAGEYRATFTCLRKRIPWHPGRGLNSIEPKIYGLQTALVVGPKGEEIHCDEYGRVRVQFHWDRVGGYNEKSSAWVRVASTWAGSNFGFVAIPRIGQEVLVQFLDGNPDRPLITGRVYNADNMPPWGLPGNKTQTGMLSRSSQGGGYDNANAIRFEDKKGEEELWLHAEKDQRIEVENDESHWVGRDRSKTIDRHETVQVKGNRTETVDLNETITVHQNRTEVVDLDETITIHKNRQERVDLNEKISVGVNRSEDVGANETISIGANRTETVGQNETINIGSNRSVTIGGAKTETIALAKAETIGLAKALTIGLAYQTSVGAMMNTTVALSQTAQIGMSKSTTVGKSYTIDAGDEFTVTVGKASLTMKSDGSILINGHTFNLGTTAEQSFNADGEITVKGKKILEN